MRINKSITASVFLLYLLFFLLLLSLGEYLKNWSKIDILHITTACYSFIPLLFILLKNKNRFIFVMNLFTLLLAYIAIFFAFRHIRNFFPASYIANNLIISYAQYNSYPLYFDTVLFFIIVFITFLVSFLYNFFLESRERYGNNQ